MATTVLFTLTGGFGSFACVGLLWLDSFVPLTVDRFFREVYDSSFDYSREIELPDISLEKFGLFSDTIFSLDSIPIPTASDPLLHPLTAMIDVADSRTLIWDTVFEGIAQHFPFDNFGHQVGEAIQTLSENATFPKNHLFWVNRAWQVLNRTDWPKSLNEVIGGDADYLGDLNKAAFCPPEVMTKRHELLQLFTEWDAAFSSRDSIRARLFDPKLDTKTLERLPAGMRTIANSFETLFASIPKALANLPVHDIAQVVKFFRSDVLWPLCFLTTCMSLSGYLVVIGWPIVTFELLWRRKSLGDGEQKSDTVRPPESEYLGGLEARMSTMSHFGSSTNVLQSTGPSSTAKTAQDDTEADSGFIY
jgi:hypothetical protein